MNNDDYKHYSHRYAAEYHRSMERKRERLENHASAQLTAWAFLISVASIITAVAVIYVNLTKP